MRWAVSQLVGDESHLAIVTDGKGPPHGFFSAPTDPPRVFFYRPSRFPGIMRLVVNFDLTPFDNLRVWLVSAIYAAVTAVVNEQGKTATTLVQENRLAALELLEQDLNQLTAFVIGGFIAYVVASWNKRRATYDQLMGQSRMLLIALNANVTTGHADAAGSGDAAAVIEEARRELCRYVLLAVELAMLDCRDNQDSARGRAQVMKMGLIEGDEWERLVSGDRMTTVYCWMATLVSRLVSRGYVSQAALHPITHEIHQTRALSRDIMTSDFLEPTEPAPRARLLTRRTLH
jgi:hypothetical protein